MIFQKKLDAALKKLHEDSNIGIEEETFEEETFEEERPGLEKNDALAMLIAALITILPVALLVLGGIVLLGWFFLMR